MKKILRVDGKRMRKELLLPEYLVEPVMKYLHEATHCGRDSLTTYIELWLTGPGISKVIEKGVTRCVVCQKNNPKIDPRQKKEGKQYQRQFPL